MAVPFCYFYVQLSLLITTISSQTALVSVSEFCEIRQSDQHAAAYFISGDWSTTLHFGTFDVCRIAVQRPVFAESAYILLGQWNDEACRMGLQVVESNGVTNKVVYERQPECQSDDNKIKNGGEHWRLALDSDSESRQLVLELKVGNEVSWSRQAEESKFGFELTVTFESGQWKVGETTAVEGQCVSCNESTEVTTDDDDDVEVETKAKAMQLTKEGMSKCIDKSLVCDGYVNCYESQLDEVNCATPWKLGRKWSVNSPATSNKHNDRSGSRMRTRSLTRESDEKTTSSAALVLGSNVRGLRSDSARKAAKVAAVERGNRPSSHAKEMQKLGVSAVHTTKDVEQRLQRTGMNELRRRKRNSLSSTASWSSWNSWSNWNTWKRNSSNTGNISSSLNTWNSWNKWENWMTWNNWKTWDAWNSWINHNYWISWNIWNTWKTWNDREISNSFNTWSTWNSWKTWNLLKLSDTSRSSSSVNSERSSTILTPWKIISILLSLVGSFIVISLRASKCCSGDNSNERRTTSRIASITSYDRQSAVVDTGRRSTHSVPSQVLPNQRNLATTVGNTAYAYSSVATNMTPDSVNLPADTSCPSYAQVATTGYQALSTQHNADDDLPNYSEALEMSVVGTLPTLCDWKANTGLQLDTGTLPSLSQLNPSEVGIPPFSSLPSYSMAASGESLLNYQPLTAGYSSATQNDSATLSGQSVAIELPNINSIPTSTVTSEDVGASMQSACTEP